MTGPGTLRGGAPVERRRPGDTYRPPNWWQAQEGQGDGRWGMSAVRYTYMNGQCRYCGDHCDGPANSVTAHPRALCLACGTPQCGKQRECLVCMIGFVGRVSYGVSGSCGYAGCGKQRECLVCMIGFVGRVSYGVSGSCGYAGCGKPAVAKAPRVGRACAFHLTKAKSRGMALDDQIARSLRLRDLGGLDWQKLTWFGPELRYAVRRWHDDGRTGWTTGADPRGFGTAGQADREAQAWNDPRAVWPHAQKSEGWHAERAELTDELRAEILAWAKRRTR